MNLPLPELFYWGSRPKMLGHHLRWQKFLQQTRIKQQRQGSPHRACLYWQFGLLSAAVVICQHTPQNPSPAPGMGAKHSPWWVQNTEQPPSHSVLYSLPGHHHSQCWQCSGSLPLLPADWRSPNKEKLHSRYLQRCSRTGELRIYSRSAFPVIPSMSRGFFPPDQFRLGLREVGKLPCQGGGQWPGVLTEPQEQ